MPREAPARAVARSKVASATTYNTRSPPHAYQSAKLLLEWRTVQLLYCGDIAAACIRPIRGHEQRHRGGRAPTRASTASDSGGVVGYPTGVQEACE